jgi:hypothetical protein
MSEGRKDGLENDPRIRELQDEIARHGQQVWQIAESTDPHWTIQLIAEDEMHYTRLLRMLKSYRAAHPPR